MVSAGGLPPVFCALSKHVPQPVFALRFNGEKRKSENRDTHSSIKLFSSHANFQVDF
jgi:hypothetical protein